MSSSRQKRKLLCGMPIRRARKKFMEIWDAANPDVRFHKVRKMFKELVPTSNLFVWMETWFRLRSHNETFDVIAQAFAEKVSAMHKQNHILSGKIHLQRQELTKLNAEIVRLKKEGGASLKGVQG